MTTVSAGKMAVRLGILARWRAMWGLYMALAKSRLSALVVMTAMVGFVVGSVDGMSWWLLAATSVGVLLAAWSANAFNQILEVSRDARMKRTMGRPLPSGRMTVGHAVMFALVCGMVGVGVLGLFVNGLAAGLAALTIALYVGVYTPLKVRTTLNTLVGAVVGAIPPMIGWAAATGSITAGAWVLGAILFVWQMPHFLALAWMYREEYERGGYRMLPTLDASGRITCGATLLYALALLPVAAAASFVGIAGWWYGMGALLLGGWVLYLSIRMWQERSVASARRVFIASVIYLPLLMVLLVMDPAPADELHGVTRLNITQSIPTLVTP